MFLQQLHLLGFKNYQEGEFSFIPGINCVVGPNGKGKTNLLDAIHYLCISKGFLNPVDSQNIAHQQPFFVIEGTFWMEGRDELIYCGLKKGAKKILKRNKKEYERLSDHIGLFPVVVISPLDSILLTGGSDERRRWMDSLISQFSHTYLENLITYNKIIVQRNALLKRMYESRMVDKDTLQIYNEQLTPLANLIHEARSAFMSDFIPMFNQIYQMLSATDETASIQYESQLNTLPIEKLLEDAFEKDRILQYTTVGIHKDDLDFILNDYPIKKFGSQGQQKTFLTALKLAEHDYLKKSKGFAPILLLDDIFDKLDTARVSNLIKKVSEEEFGQVFITDTGKEKISAIFNTFEITANFITP
jgi:DNA replication and repair protein RecF